MPGIQKFLFRFRFQRNNQWTVEIRYQTCINVRQKKVACNLTVTNLETMWKVVYFLWYNFKLTQRSNLHGSKLLKSVLNMYIQIIFIATSVRKRKHLNARMFIISLHNLIFILQDDKCIGLKKQGHLLLTTLCFYRSKLVLWKRFVQQHLL